VDTIPAQTPSPQSDAVGMLKLLAESSRKDEGNSRFDVWQSDRRNHFTVVEAWRNQRALDAHTAAMHTKQYREQLQPLAGSPLDERVFTVLK
jgi:quinol monooxygenase YgiN